MTRKWRALRINRDVSHILKLAWALALLPAERFREGLEVIRQQATRIRNEPEQLVVFLNYLERYWLPLAPIVSVRSTAVRTNNIAESFHRQLSQRLGGSRPNLFVFLGNNIFFFFLNIDNKIILIYKMYLSFFSYCRSISHFNGATKPKMDAIKFWS